MATTQIRCPNGHGWFLKGEECPECKYAPRFNKSLRTAQLNAHLHEMAARA